MPQYSGGKDVSVDRALTSVANTTLLRRLPTLGEEANVAAFLASDQATAIAGTVVKLNGGSAVD